MTTMLAQSAPARPASPSDRLELTILMPCLNEARTLTTCITKARRFLDRTGIAGEVLIADNGSDDGSQAIAAAAGARVIPVPVRGYGAALNAGIRAARGRFVILGDADDSYDFSALDAFVDALRGGADLVIGNRFRGGIDRDAMPLLHRYLGNPVLSFLGRLFFSIPIGDFHCGLRGCRQDLAERVGLRTTGMEFASEMIVASALHGLRFAEVPTTLRKDGRDRPPHLRTWRDGWRHLRFLLMFSPRWLFLVPGLLLFVGSALLLLRLAAGPVQVGRVTFDVHTMVYLSAFTSLGFQMICLAVFAKTYVVRSGLHRVSRSIEGVWRYVSLESGLVAGAVLGLLGVGLAAHSLMNWGAREFGALDPVLNLRAVILAATAMLVGTQLMVASFFLSVLSLRRAD